jgi:hypothetical protein
MRYSFNLTSHFEGQYPDRWLLVVILWVYLPKYSTTDFWLQKVFGKNNQGLLHNSCRICSVFYGLLSFELSQYFCHKTFDKALQGTEIFPSAVLPLLLFVNSATRECNAMYGWTQLLSPSVRPLSFLPEFLCFVLQRFHVASNKVCRLFWVDVPKN